MKRCKYCNAVLPRHRRAFCDEACQSNWRLQQTRSNPQAALKRLAREFADGVISEQEYRERLNALRE